MQDLPFDRIVCGDAIRILQTLTTQSIDLVVTDPPYGDNIGYGPENVRIAGNEHPLLALMTLTACYRVLKRNTTAYMFCGMRHLDFVRSFFGRYTRYRIGEVIIWDKIIMNVGPSFRKQYECILVLEKGRPAYHNTRMLNLLRVKRIRNPEHPHAKPIALLKLLIEHSSTPGAVVLDPFVGTGATALAAQELGRHYIGIEIAPAYHRIAENKLNTAKAAA
jgi:DNA modification methylase